MKINIHIEEGLEETRQLNVLLQNCETRTLPAGAGAADALAALLLDGSVEAIHSSEPNLESVFIALTGRKLA